MRRLKANFTASLLFANAEELQLEEAEQTHSGKGTSLNPAQMRGGMPALFGKPISWPPGGRVFDIGAGQPAMAEQMRAWFAEKDITYLPYDLNWGTEYNMGTEAELKQQKADVATASNLLNVIPDQTNRLNVLRRMYNALKPGGKIYITVHRESGKKPGESGADKWQNHWSLNEYLPEVQSVFGDSAIVQGGMIRATK